MTLVTNVSAIAALDVLRTVEKTLSTTQDRISSGLRVQTAQDNAAYWSISTTMRSDSEALSTVQDALGLAQAKSDTAYSAVDAALNITQEIRNKLLASREPGADKTKIDKELTELKNQLKSVAQSASFSGENWLYNDSTAAIGTKEMVGSFIRSSTGSVSIGTIKFDASKTVLIDTKDEKRGLLTKDIAVTTTSDTSTATTTTNYWLIDGGSTGATGTEIKLTVGMANEDIDKMVKAVEEMNKQLTDVASTLGALQTGIALQKEFAADLQDTMETGIGRLVDADMNSESTMLKALQTQQQLAIQALSIANGQSDSILQLFR